MGNQENGVYFWWADVIIRQVTILWDTLIMPAHPAVTHSMKWEFCLGLLSQPSLCLKLERTLKLETFKKVYLQSFLNAVRIL